MSFRKISKQLLNSHIFDKLKANRVMCLGLIIARKNELKYKINWLFQIIK